MFEVSTTVEEPISGPLDRVALAIAARRAGQFVDFEDWDGLPDDWVRQMYGHQGLEADVIAGEQVVLNPEQQTQHIKALGAGDKGMFERAAQSGLFTMLIEGYYEV